MRTAYTLLNMKKINLSLKTLLVTVTTVNIPLLIYLFLNVHGDRNKVYSVIQPTSVQVVSVRDVAVTTSSLNTTHGARNKQIENNNNNNDINSSSSSNSNNHSKEKNQTFLTDVFENLTDKWKPIDTTPNAHYVFSAFLHKIGSASTIRIIGAACQKSIKSPIFCQLRYKRFNGNESILTVKGSVKQLPEGIGFKYRAAFFHCRLPDERIPEAVSVIANADNADTSLLNLLPVRSHVIKPDNQKKFAVCVSPLFGEYNSISNLIQWIELNRILGAELFVFYNYSVGKNVDQVLQFYIDKGLAKVIPWDVTKFRPPGKKHELSYVGQTVALNECLMRVKPVSEFVVNCDLDEVIVPHGGLTTWHDIVNKHPDVSIYNFKSSFFRLNWDNTDKEFPRKNLAERYKLSFLLKLDREVKIFPPNDRTKYFAKTKVADALGVHKVFETSSPHESEVFALGVGLIHHYRIIYATINGVSQPDYIHKGPKVFDDTIIQQYKDKLIDNVIKIYDELYR